MLAVECSVIAHLCSRLFRLTCSGLSSVRKARASLWNNYSHATAGSPLRSSPAGDVAGRQGRVAPPLPLAVPPAHRAVFAGPLVAGREPPKAARSARGGSSAVNSTQ